MNKNNNFDFESFKQGAIKGMYAGRPLTEKRASYAPLLKHFLEAALEGSLKAIYRNKSRRLIQSP